MSKNVHLHLASRMGSGLEGIEEPLMLSNIDVFNGNGLIFFV